MNRSLAFFYLITALVAGLLLSCGTAQAIMLVSEKTEISIGKDVAKQAEQQFGGVSTDAKSNARVESIGKKLVAVSDRKQMPYTFKILNTKELNAFACPGGPVYITQGLLDKLTTDDELAFVLGHEIGHISKQHSRKAINKALMANALATVLFSRKDKMIQQGVGIAWTVIDRGHSRDQEYEADRFGTTYAMKAGFKGSGAVDALSIIQKESGGEGKSSGLNKLLSTHPPTPDRISRVKGMLKE